MQHRKWIVVIMLLTLALTACDGGDKSTPTPQAPQTTPTGYPAPAESTLPSAGYPAPVDYPTPTLPEGYVAPSP